MKLRKTLISAATSAALAFAATGAYADLTYLGPTEFGGTGLGTVNTVLTIQNPPRTGYETGSVGLNSLGQEVTTGTVVKTGESQTLVRSFSSLGITQASDLSITLNANEPNPVDDVKLWSLVLNVFNPSGALLFSTSYADVPFIMQDTFSGTGTSGFVFGLDATSVTALQSVLDVAGSGDYVIGLSAALNRATGGPETFYVSSNVVSPIPEPETYAMMLAGLGLLGFMARRKGKKLA